MIRKLILIGIFFIAPFFLGAQQGVRRQYVSHNHLWSETDLSKRLRVGVDLPTCLTGGKAWNGEASSYMSISTGMASAFGPVFSYLKRYI